MNICRFISCCTQDKEEHPRTALLTTQGHARVLFISSHISANIGQGEHAAGILLAAADGDGPAVQLAVPSYDLFSMQLKADIVVLSGCAGALSLGDASLMSAAAALLTRTGAKVVLGTAWPVSDIGATFVWAELAPRLAAGEDPELALAAVLAHLASVLAGSSPGQFVDDLLARYPSLASPQSRGALIATASSSANLPGAVLSLSDLACWTILAR